MKMRRGASLKLVEGLAAVGSKKCELLTDKPEIRGGYCAEDAKNVRKERVNSQRNAGKKEFSFAYFERLHSQRDFNRTLKNGIRLENKDIKILAYRRNDGDIVRRLGLVTPKKVGTAVERNRTKRRLREIFRTSKHSLKAGIDLIFISKRETTSLDYGSLKKNILGLLKNAKLFSDSE